MRPVQAQQQEVKGMQQAATAIQNEMRYENRPSVGEAPTGVGGNKTTGRVFLVSDVLKGLRNEKLQSQEEMAFACSDQKIRVSIASIKRAETGKPVIYRVARELARYFNVPVQHLIRTEPPAGN